MTQDIVGTHHCYFPCQTFSALKNMVFFLFCFVLTLIEGHPTGILKKRESQNLSIQRVTYMLNNVNVVCIL